MDFDNYNKNELPKLPAEDENKELAWIYYEGRHELRTQAEKDAIRKGNVLDAADVLTMDAIVKMYLEHDETKTGPKMGYGLTPEGIGYGCTNADIPGYDLAVRDFHLKWVAEDPGFHYKLWYPGAHEIHYDQAAVEDCGWGMADLLMHWGGTKEVGLPENYREINPYLTKITVINGRGHVLGTEWDDGGFSTVIHLPMNNGEHQWSFALIGANVQDGKIVDRRNAYEKAHPEIMLERARLMTSHFLYENTQLSYLMGKVYPVYKDRIAGKNLPDNPESLAAYFNY